MNNGIQAKASAGLAFTAKFDGRQYPTKGTSASTVTLERVDPHTIRAVYEQQDGSVSRVSTLAVSGATLTETSTITQPNGTTLKIVTVFDKE